MTLDSETPLIVVAGPTASGKTSLALLLAEELGGEIVSCDSVAVYRLMEIGTAKPSAAERAIMRVMRERRSLGYESVGSCRSLRVELGCI